MDYSPTPGSNIDKILKCVSKQPTTAKEIKNRILLKYPEVPPESLGTHLNFLMKKGLVAKREGLWSIDDGQTEIPLEGEKLNGISKSTKILNYCKTRVGKKVTSGECREAINDESSIAADSLRKLNEMGAIQLISESRPYTYLVLPEIKMFEKVTGSPRKKQELIAKEKEIENRVDDNIADMSIGDILTKFVQVQHENKRLREGLQRIAHELFQLGEIE